MTQPQQETETPRTAVAPDAGAEPAKCPNARFHEKGYYCETCGDGLDATAAVASPVLEGGETEPTSDAMRLKAHLRGCAECSAGDFCDEGERYGGDVTADYLYRITVGNGCRPDAALEAIADRRAKRRARAGGAT